MNVFLSWSGYKSLQVALILKDWLPLVIPSVETYAAAENMDKETRWNHHIAQKLEGSDFGILCVTDENMHAPWLTFEAGALAKKLKKSCVNSFLFDVEHTEIDGPIVQFQSNIADKEHTLKLLNAINTASGKTKLSDGQLEEAFTTWYPFLKEKLNNLKEEFGGSGSIRKASDNEEQEMKDELVQLTRVHQKETPILPITPLEKNGPRRPIASAERTGYLKNEVEPLLYQLRSLIRKYKKGKALISDNYEELVHKINDLHYMIQEMETAVEKTDTMSKKIPNKR
ncbi:MAG: hypothetical protein AAGB24_15400 [Bacteroidota bacterium]